MDDFSNPGISDAWGIYASPCTCISSCSTIYPHLYRTDNYPEPYKRPLSSITPLIMEHTDGSLYLVAGGSGGSRIFGGVFQTILNLDWGLDARQAVEYGRLHDQLYPTYLDIDETYPSDLIEQLADRGHNITGMSDIPWSTFIQELIITRSERHKSYRCGNQHCNATTRWKDIR